ncbi:hypothetical protein [Kitasatospora fiedleri]|uniref:hypothetical protein n=1 Tax=Kitasatospora fiedleri TaxID=2991545 RepID=UPI00249BAC80|nr:hypothetical protein [Kitasatospora fiedleri]
MERFHVQLMGNDDPRPGMWGVRDRDRWAEAGGEPDYYPDRYGAEQARHRLRAMHRVA